MHDRARLYVRGTCLIRAIFFAPGRDGIDRHSVTIGLAEIWIPWVGNDRVIESPQTERDEEVCSPPVGKTGSAQGVIGQRHTGRAKESRYGMAHNRITKDVFPVVIEASGKDLLRVSAGQSGAVLECKKCRLPID